MNLLIAAITIGGTVLATWQNTDTIFPDTTTPVEITSPALQTTVDANYLQGYSHELTPQN